MSKTHKPTNPPCDEPECTVCNSATTFSFSDICQPLDIKSLQEAIENLPKVAEEEIEKEVQKVIAYAGQFLGFKTYVSDIVPKGKIIIGNGDQIMGLVDKDGKWKAPEIKVKPNKP